MKKTFKKALSIISAMSVLAATSMFYTAGAVYYGNDITDVEISGDKIKNEYITFKDGSRISMCYSNAYIMNYIVDSSVENVSNEYFGISKDFAIRKINFGETSLYSVKTETREEMDNLFKLASELCDGRKINDAYSRMNIIYGPMDLQEISEGVYEWLVLESAEREQMVNYIKEEPELILEGDVNGDNELNVRDCADSASDIAKNNTKQISSIADYNIDGNVNVRDAAAIAKYLAEK